MPWASYQWISALRIRPLRSRTNATPFIFFHRPGPHLFFNWASTRICRPAAIISTALNAPTISNFVFANRDRPCACFGHGSTAKDSFKKTTAFPSTERLATEGRLRSFRDRNWVSMTTRRRPSGWIAALLTLASACARANSLFGRSSSTSASQRSSLCHLVGRCFMASAQYRRAELRRSDNGTAPTGMAVGEVIERVPRPLARSIGAAMAASFSGAPNGNRRLVSAVQPPRGHARRRPMASGLYASHSIES